MEDIRFLDDAGRITSLTTRNDEELMALSYIIVASPIGKLKLVASDVGLVAILWENDDPRRVRLAELAEQSSHPVLLRVEQELREYFNGKRNAFTLPLEMRGTPSDEFQDDVMRDSWRRTMSLEVSVIGQFLAAQVSFEVEKYAY